MISQPQLPRCSKQGQCHSPVPTHPPTQVPGGMYSGANKYQTGGEMSIEIHISLLCTTRRMYGLPGSKTKLCLPKQASPVPHPSGSGYDCANRTPLLVESNKYRRSRAYLLLRITTVRHCFFRIYCVPSRTQHSASHNAHVLMLSMAQEYQFFSRISG